MTEPTDAQLAVQLRDLARSPHTTLGEAEYLFLAAQRLEARGEISEAMARAGYEAYWGAGDRKPGVGWDMLSAAGRDNWRSVLRAAEAARKGTEP